MSTSTDITTDAPTDAEFSEFLNSLMADNAESTDEIDWQDWLDALLAGCADSVSNSLGDDYSVTPERDRSGAHQHKLHVHHKATGKHVGSFNVSA